MNQASTTSYRFIPSADGLDRMFAAYELARQSEGIGTTLWRVSPSQRIDAVVTMLSLNASEGWRRIGAETAESLWLRYLTPVLAETRESAVALSLAVAGRLPGEFDPTVPTGWTGPAEPPEPPEVKVERPSSPARRRLARFVEDARNFLLDRRVLAGFAAAVIAAAGVYLLWSREPAPIIVPPKPPIVANGGGSRGGGTYGSGGISVDTSDREGESYRAALAVTLATVQQNGGEITPRLLARTYAGESDIASEPALFLSAMLEEWPLPPDAPIPRDGAGRWALQRYAAVFSAVEQSRPVPHTLPELDRGTVDDEQLRRALDTFPDGRQVGGPQQVVAATWSNWLPWMAFLPLLPALAWSAATFVPAVRASLSNPKRKTLGTPASLPVDAIAGRMALPPERRLARQISWSEPVAGRRIHAERSIRATLARGGYLTPVVRFSRHSANYLFLVPRRRRDDHERERVSRLIDALARGGVSIDVYDYDPDPRCLFARRANEMSADGERTMPMLDLRGLRELHPDSRLVLVTDGSELVDYFTQRPQSYVADELATWPMRMLLTPLPVSEWGEREMNLADGLGAVVGRATPEGFRDLAKIFGDRRRALPRPAKIPAAGGHAEMLARLVTWLSASLQLLGGRDSFARRPRALRFDDPTLTSDAEPPADEVEALVAALRSWLGPRGFQWLAACAAYPQLRFAITLYLGLKIVIQRGPVSEPLYDETLLAQLTLLPWFRVGRMPPWLRRALFAALPEAARDRARAAMDAMLNERSVQGSTTLPIWLAAEHGLDIPPDAVMADLMMRDVSDVTPVLRGKAFAGLFGDQARQALRVRVGLVSVTALWCLGAWYFWPAPAASPHPGGAWLALGAYAIVTIAGLGLVLAGLAYRGWPAINRVRPA